MVAIVPLLVVVATPVVATVACSVAGVLVVIAAVCRLTAVVSPYACNGGCAGTVIEEAPVEAAPAEAPAEVPAAPAEESSADASAAPKVVYRSVVYRR